MSLCFRDALAASDMNCKIFWSLDVDPTNTAGRIFKAASYCWVGLAISNWAWKSTSTISRSASCMPLKTTSMYSYSPAIREKQHMSFDTTIHKIKIQAILMVTNMSRFRETEAPHELPHTTTHKIEIQAILMVPKMSGIRETEAHEAYTHNHA